MTFMLILLAIAVGLCIETIRALFNDGRPLRPPVSHLQDPLFVAPSRQVGRPSLGAAYPPRTTTSGSPQPIDISGAPAEVLQFGRHQQRK